MTIFFFKQYALLFALFSKEDCIFISKWSEKVGFLKAKYACASDIKTLHLCKFTFSNSLSLIYSYIKCSVTKNSNITLLIRNMYVM